MARLLDSPDLQGFFVAGRHDMISRENDALNSGKSEMAEFQGLPERSYKLRVFDVQLMMRGLNLSAADLAKKIDVSTRALNKWLKGEPLFVKNIVALSEVFGTSPQSLIEGMEPCAANQMAHSKQSPALSMALNIDCATPEEFMYLCELLGEVKEKMEGFRKKSEKRVRVYFIEAVENPTGRETYFYALASSLLHGEMQESLKRGTIPDYAVIIESGYGKPSEELREYIKRYYGFDENDFDPVR